MEDSLKKRYVIKLFASMVSGIIGAIIIALVPKALGPVVYGQFVYLQDFFLKIMGFLDMGSSIAFFTKLSSNNNRKELILFYFMYSFLVLFLVIIFIFGVKGFGYTDLILPNIPNEYIYMGLFFGFFTWFTQIFIKISDAYALTVSVELIKIGHKVASLLLLLYFIYFTSFDLNSYFYFQYIALVSFLVILTWLYINKYIFSKDIFKAKSLRFKKLSKEFFEYCSPLFMYSTVGIVVGLFDIWLLQKMSGSIQTGFYGLAYGLAAMCFLFTSAMTPIITREFSIAYKEDNIEKMRSLFSRYIPMLYAIAAYFGVFVSMQSENILDIFTDEKFKDAYWVLVVMAFYPIHQTYGQLSGSIFYATGQTRLYKNIGISSMGIGMILSLFFIYALDFGALGLAWKMVIGQIIGVNIQLYFNSKFLNFDIKKFLLHQIITVFLFICIAYIATNLVVIKSSLTELLISGIIYTFLVIILIYLIPSIFSITREEINENLKKLRKKVRSK